MKKKMMLVSEITVGILVLAVVAYLAVTWMTPGNGGGNLLGLSIPGIGGRQVGRRALVTPAPEQPATEPDIAGYLVEIQDKSLIVQPIIKGAQGLVESGPHVEVVITNQTRLYRDATYDNMIGPQANNTNSVQQIMKPMTTDEIVVDGTLALIWGERRGSRLNATVIILQQEVNQKEK